MVTHLKDGKIILDDRYFWDTLTYGYGLGLDMDWLTLLQLKFPIPDESFYMKTPKDLCLERIGKSRLTHDLFETAEMLTRVENGYQILLEKYGDQITIIDGRQSSGAVTQQIIAKVMNNPKFERLANVVEELRKD